MERLELKAMRVRKGFKQVELAKKLGVSVSTYNLVENGKRDGSNKFWLAVQKEFKLSGGEVWNLKNPCN